MSDSMLTASKCPISLRIEKSRTQVPIAFFNSQDNYLTAGNVNIHPSIDELSCIGLPSITYPVWYLQPKAQGVYAQQATTNLVFAQRNRPPAKYCLCRASLRIACETVAGLAHCEDYADESNARTLAGQKRHRVLLCENKWESSSSNVRLKVMLFTPKSSTVSCFESQTLHSRDRSRDFSNSKLHLPQNISAISIAADSEVASPVEPREVAGW